MPDDKVDLEALIDKIRRVAQNIRTRDIEAFVMGVKYKRKNEDGTGCFVTAGDPVAMMAMSGKMLNLVLDQLFIHNKENPKSVLGMFLQSMIEGSSINSKVDDPEKKKTDDLLKDIHIDEDLRKKLDGDVPGLDDMLGGK